MGQIWIERGIWQGLMWAVFSMNTFFSMSINFYCNDFHFRLWRSTLCSNHCINLANNQGKVSFLNRQRACIIYLSHAPKLIRKYVGIKLARKILLVKKILNFQPPMIFLHWKTVVPVHPYFSKCLIVSVTSQHAR